MRSVRGVLEGDERVREGDERVFWRVMKGLRMNGGLIDDSLTFPSFIKIAISKRAKTYEKKDE